MLFSRIGGQQWANKAMVDSTKSVSQTELRESILAADEDDPMAHIILPKVRVICEIRGGANNKAAPMNGQHYGQLAADLSKN